MIRDRVTAVLTVGILGFGLVGCTNQLPTFVEEGEILAIEIINACSVIEQGNSCTLRATAFAEGGLEVPNAILFWSSSDPQILTVQSQANDRTVATVRGTGGGTATVSVSNSDRTATSETSVRVQSIEGGGECEVNCL